MIAEDFLHSRKIVVPGRLGFGHRLIHPAQYQEAGQQVGQEAALALDAQL